MRRLPAEELLATLRRKGFDVVETRSAAIRLTRRTDDRHDHVALALSPAPWWRRLARLPRTVEQVVVGVVWPIGEMAFSRPVPSRPALPEQAHAATSFTGLIGLDPTDVATLAAAVDDWCRRLEDPTRALRIGAIDEPMRRLEFAVVTSEPELGEVAAAAAREEARGLPAGPRERAMQRIESAEQRLPRT